MKSRKSVLAAASIVLALAASAATAASETSWNYAPSYSGTNVANGYITLSESDSGATLQFFSNNMNICFRGQLSATVARTPEAVSVTVNPKMSGCDSIRFTMKADGSGGIRETMVGGNWKSDGQNRVLTLR